MKEQSEQRRVSFAPEVEYKYIEHNQPGPRRPRRPPRPLGPLENLRAKMGWGGVGELGAIGLGLYIVHQYKKRSTQKEQYSDGSP